MPPAAKVGDIHARPMQIPCMPHGEERRNNSENALVRLEVFGIIKVVPFESP